MANRDHEESMTEAEIVDATYWAGFWSRIEHWMFLGVVLTLALEFIALKFAEPHKEKLEHHRESRLAELRTESERLSKEAETARKETAAAQLQLQQMRSPRRLDFEKLKAGIEGVEPQFFEVLYDQSAADASFLAGAISVALRSAGWKTDQKLPAPLTPQLGPSDLRDVYQLLPLTEQAGSGTPWGVSVITKGPISEDPNAPERILAMALLQSVASPAGIVGGGKDETMPAGKIRIIVGPKLP
jgi:hypothetical protein